MSKYVLIPDSFKGTLSSADICRIAAEEILRLEPPAEVCAIPVADGGEGTVDAFLAAVGGRRIEAPCTGPWGEPVTAHYALLPDGTAVVEMAAAAGLPLAGDACDPEKTTTYGVGQLMAHALSHGAVRLVLGLGGSATNDGGCGAAAALGAEFLDEQGSAFVPVGGTLTRIARIRTETLRRTLGGVPVTVMCDIDNPLCGPEGAAAVFGPQKGADAAMVARLDAGLRHLAQVLARDLGMEVLTLSGGGAAGGFGAGAATLFGGVLRMGIDTVLDAVDFDQRCRGARLVITGEGHLDSQSMRGKTVIGVARRAKALGIPVAALAGGCETALDAVLRGGGVRGVPRQPVALHAGGGAAARTGESAVHRGQSAAVHGGAGKVENSSTITLCITEKTSGEAPGGSPRSCAFARSFSRGYFFWPQGRECVQGKP